MELKGQTAIVTGASKGIGKATAEALLNAGCKVAGWSRTDPKIEHKHFLFIETDMSKPEAIQQAYGQTHEKLGTPTILINNAGLGIFSPFELLTPEDWHRMFDVNIHAIYYACHVALPGMKQAGGGHIINISSIAGKQGNNQGSGYSATKFAVRGFSEALYREVRVDGVKVTCLFPGSVDTNFFDDIEGTSANPTMLHSEDIAQAILDVLRSRDNVNISEVELRPMNPKYK